MNRFFRSALFPLIIIAALVWLALQTLGSHGPKVEKQTYSQLIALVKTDPTAIDSVQFVPNKQEIDATIKDGSSTRKIVVHYPTDQSQYGFQQLLCQRSGSESSQYGDCPAVTGG